MVDKGKVDQRIPIPWEGKGEGNLGGERDAQAKSLRYWMVENVGKRLQLLQLAFSSNELRSCGRGTGFPCVLGREFRVWVPVQISTAAVG